MNPEIERFRAMWLKDPRSRVFAPLAEAYRKIGMLDEAIAICKQGLSYHPQYLSGRVALGRAFFEKGLLEDARRELEAVRAANPDNILATKTLAGVYDAQGAPDKALDLIDEIARLGPLEDDITAWRDDLRRRVGYRGIDVPVAEERPEPEKPAGSPTRPAPAPTATVSEASGATISPPPPQESMVAVTSLANLDLSEEELEATDIFFEKAVEDSQERAAQYSVAPVSQALHPTDAKGGVTPEALARIYLRQNFHSRAASVLKKAYGEGPYPDEAQRLLDTALAQEQPAGYSEPSRLPSGQGRLIGVEDAANPLGESFQVKNNLTDWLTHIREGGGS